MRLLTGVTVGDPSRVFGPYSYRPYTCDPWVTAGVISRAFPADSARRGSPWSGPCAPSPPARNTTPHQPRSFPPAPPIHVTWMGSPLAVVALACPGHLRVGCPCGVAPVGWPLVVGPRLALLPLVAPWSVGVAYVARAMRCCLGLSGCAARGPPGFSWCWVLLGRHLVLALSGWPGVSPSGRPWWVSPMGDHPSPGFGCWSRGAALPVGLVALPGLPEWVCCSRLCALPADRLLVVLPARVVGSSSPCGWLAHGCVPVPASQVAPSFSRWVPVSLDACCRVPGHVLVAPAGCFSCGRAGAFGDGS